MSLKGKMLLLLIAGGALLWGLNAASGGSNVDEVPQDVHQEAVNFSEKILKSARKDQLKQFAALAQNPELRDPLRESLQLLREIELNSEPRWEVTRTRSNGDINVFFDISTGRRALILLRENPGGMKFVYAMVP